MDTESPSYAMYRVLRDFGGIPYRDAAAVIVDAGAASGESTLGARIADKTFLSRRVVHASAGNAPVHADLGGAAEALAARMAKRLGEGAWGLICEHFAGPGTARMEESLSACGHDALVYRNACARVAGAGELDSRSRATLLVLLFIAAGVTADPALAASEARGYADRRLGASVRTPPPSIVKGKKRAESPAPEGLGLLRADGSCAKPPIYEVSRGPEGTVIGSIPCDGDSIADVGPDVSRRHARVRLVDGQWLLEDLGSTNGTWVVPGGSPAQGRKPIRVEPGRPVAIQNADQILLGSSTRFLVMRTAR